MIKRIKLRHFKRFEDQVFKLGNHIVLAGPNNSGKTTLLQAIAVWNLALQKWLGRRAGSNAKKRTGVSITRKDFTAIPLREMNLLWTNTSTNFRKHELEGKKAGGAPRPMSITLEGRTKEGDWALTFEFTYQSSEQIYARPSADHLEEIPKAAEDFQVVHVPPFSGIGAEETRYDHPYQDLLIGQGKAGDIVRNLLYEVSERGGNEWELLTKEIEALFGFHLLEPQYAGRPYILCQYLPEKPQGRGRSGLPTLDIASGGSGFHQVLLLLGFFYARPASLLLLDEPDAHLHVILQKQIYDRLRSLASRRKSQLIDGTGPNDILSFYDTPHVLLTDRHRDQVREALKRITSMDLLLADQASGVLYVEGESDFELLKAWARVLEHPMLPWFETRPYWRSNQGRHPKEARHHFFASRAIRPELSGFLLLDGDNRGLRDRELLAAGLEIARWERYEIESYLMHPEALERYVSEDRGPVCASAGMDYLRDELPPAVWKAPLAQNDWMRGAPVSKGLLPDFFDKCGMDLPKREYYLIAEQMRSNEVHPDVKRMLDRIAAAVGGFQ